MKVLELPPIELHLREYNTETAVTVQMYMSKTQLFRMRKTYFIFVEKQAYFNAFYPLSNILNIC